MKRALCVAGLLFSALHQTPFAQAQSYQPAEVIDQIAAIIGNDVVTEQDVWERAAPALANKTEQPRKTLYKQALDDLVSEKLLDLEMNKVRDKLSISESQVDKAIDQLATANNISRETLITMLPMQGMTEKEFRTNMRKQLERSQLIQMRVQGKVNISERDTERQCQEIARSGGELELKVRHILLKIAADATDDTIEKAKRKIEVIHEKLVNGADFSELATLESQDTSAVGGDLGFIKRGEMPAAFERAAFALGTGELSAPFRSELGFHVVRVDEQRKQTADTCDKEGVKAQLAQSLYQREFERLMRIYVDELKKKSFVDIKNRS